MLPIEIKCEGSRTGHDIAPGARRRRFTRKSLPVSTRRRVRRVSVTSRARGRVAAGLFFSAPATLCTRRTRRLGAEPIAVGIWGREQASGRQCDPTASTAAARRRCTARGASAVRARCPRLAQACSAASGDGYPHAVARAVFAEPILWPLCGSVVHRTGAASRAWSLR